MKGVALAGLTLTMAAVAVLLGSMILGIGGGTASTSEGAGSDAPITTERRIRVEVLNAAGIPRLAQRGTDHLRDRGFDVVHFGNAQGFDPDTTLVLDRVGDPEAAAAVASALGVQRVRSVPDSTLYLEVTVILGSDWGILVGEDAVVE